MDWLDLLKGGLLTIVPAAIAIVGGLCLLFEWVFMLTAVQGKGTVIRIDQTVDSEGDPMFLAVYRLEPSTGEPAIEVRDNLSFGKATLKVDDVATLYYPPGQPQRARRYRLWLTLVYATLTGIGVYVEWLVWSR